jgi:hypothetical protein
MPTRNAHSAAAAAFKVLVDSVEIAAPSPSFPTSAAPSGRILPSLVETESSKDPSAPTKSRHRAVKSTGEEVRANSRPVTQSESRKKTTKTKSAKPSVGKPVRASEAVQRLPKSTGPDANRRAGSHSALPNVENSRLARKTKRSASRSDAKIGSVHLTSSDAKPEDVSTSEYPSSREPVADSRKARVLSRCLFRKQFAPEDGWKRRIQMQRDRRAAK